MLFSHLFTVSYQVNDFGLRAGTSAETSGGLLVLLENEAVAQCYINDLRRETGLPWGWIVGRVVDPSETVVVSLESSASSSSSSVTVANNLDTMNPKSRLIEFDPIVIASLPRNTAYIVDNPTIIHL